MNKKFKRHISLRPHRRAAAAETTPRKAPSCVRGLAKTGSSSAPGQPPRDLLLVAADRAPGGP